MDRWLHSVVDHGTIRRVRHVWNARLASGFKLILRRFCHSKRQNLMVLPLLLTRHLCLFNRMQVTLKTTVIWVGTLRHKIAIIQVFTFVIALLQPVLKNCDQVTFITLVCDFRHNFFQILLFFNGTKLYCILSHLIRT